MKKSNKYQKGLFKIKGLLFKKQEVILFGVFILAILFSFYRSKDRLEQLNKLLANKFFTLSLVAIICFSSFIFYSNKYYAIFLLVCLQGFIGWFMVLTIFLIFNRNNSHEKISKYELNGLVFVKSMFFIYLIINF